MVVVPKLRDETANEIELALRMLVWQNFKNGPFPFRNCLNCKSFAEKAEMCYKYNARPPARIIAFGCDGYEDMTEIPY